MKRDGIRAFAWLLVVAGVMAPPALLDLRFRSANRRHDFVRTALWILLLLFATILPLPALGAPYAYIASQDSAARVYVLDVGSNTALPPVEIDHGPPCGIIANPAGTRGYTADCFFNSISVIDTRSNSLITMLTVRPGFVGTCLAVHPSGAFLHVAGGGLVAVDLQTGSVAKATSLGGCSLAINPNGTLLYLANVSQILVVDTTNLEVVNRIERPGGCACPPNPPPYLPVGCPDQLAQSRP